MALEKNIEAFLKLDLPGTKWVCGEGPSRARSSNDATRTCTSPATRGRRSSRQKARAYAEQFSWQASVNQFVGHLAPTAARRAA